MTRRASSPALEALRAGRRPPALRPWYFDLLRGAGLLLAVLGTLLLALAGLGWVLAPSLSVLGLTLVALAGTAAGLFLWDHFK